MDLTTALVTIGLVVVGWAANQGWQEFRTRRECRRLQGETETLRAANEKIVQGLIP